MNSMTRLANGSAFPSLKTLASIVAGHGRFGDTKLALISRDDAVLLKALGGSGTINPATGLPEYFDFGNFSFDPEPSDYVSESSRNTSAPDTSFDYKPEPSNYVSETSRNPGGDTGSIFNPGDYVSQSSQNQPADNSGAAPFAAPAPQQPAAPVQPQAAPTAPAPAAAPPANQGNWLNALKDPATLAKLGVTAYGAIRNKQTMDKAQKQANGVQDQFGALASPYKTQADQLMAQANAGQLTPQQQKALDDYKAQATQQFTNAGQPVGSAATQQINAQAENMRQTFIQNLKDQALQLMQIGDQYAQQGISAGYKANQDLQKSTEAFYSNLANMVSNALGTKPQQPAQQPGAHS
jgi:hypothetical protein